MSDYVVFLNEYRSRSDRCRGRDYASPGGYFVTLCTQGHRCWFGEVRDGRMVLNKLGQIANMCWREISIHHDNILIDAFVVMPNHVHGILMITDDVGATEQSVATLHATSLRGVQQSETDYFSAISLKKGPLSIVMRKYKSVVLQKILTYLNPVFAWQARYYDHILCRESDLEDIRLYIALNPINWGKGDRSTQEEDPIFA